MRACSVKNHLFIKNINKIFGYRKLITVGRGIV